MIRDDANNRHLRPDPRNKRGSAQRSGRHNGHVRPDLGRRIQTHMLIRREVIINFQETLKIKVAEHPFHPDGVKLQFSLINLQPTQCLVVRNRLQIGQQDFALLLHPHERALYVQDFRDESSYIQFEERNSIKGCDSGLEMGSPKRGPIASNSICPWRLTAFKAFCQGLRLSVSGLHNPPNSLSSPNQFRAPQLHRLHHGRASLAPTHRKSADDRSDRPDGAHPICNISSIKTATPGEISNSHDKCKPYQGIASDTPFPLTHASTPSFLERILA